MSGYLPSHPRSGKPTLPSNPEHGVDKKDSTTFRALLVLPFLGLLSLAANRMVVDGAFPALGKMIEHDNFTWDGGSVPIPSFFYHIKWLDDLWRPIAVLFAVWNLDIDHVAW
jgi:hypothetical protein